MTAKYFAILTSQGAARLANAAALGTKLNLTQMAVGDANGTLPTPDPAQTKLINQKRIAPLNMLSVDPANPSQIIAEQIIPETEGGFWIREIGLYDEDGVLIAVANCPETYKPQLQEGSGRTQTIRMILVVSGTSAITLKIDPAVVLATRQYVEGQVIVVKQYADDVMSAHLAADNPHAQYMKIGEFAKYVPVGVPLPYPGATPPAGFLKYNGATFDKAKYPELAKLFPSGYLLDLRGEFIRGWDDGRGIDSGRGVLSIQDATYVAFDPFRGDKTFVGLPGIDSSDFAAMRGDILSGTDTSVSWQYFDVSTLGLQQGPITGGWAVGARPRNIAMNYITRAA